MENYLQLRRGGLSGREAEPDAIDVSESEEENQRTEDCQGIRQHADYDSNSGGVSSRNTSINVSDDEGCDDSTTARQENNEWSSHEDGSGEDVEFNEQRDEPLRFVSVDLEDRASHYMKLSAWT
ncbi:uncharacterized protein LOC117168713 isoform X2 [Belonocnema kinseyi]|uniref:uncharacterized protein LOC117168713 isoform X2 n=1 Tax=Belonocnema kinseyi TaxID=2817044 RepID=UPI00143D4CC2|nr:uncharacterized protein LOC117168713 isoform X2 [Belonocnema kinseyi]